MLTVDAVHQYNDNNQNRLDLLIKEIFYIPPSGKPYVNVTRSNKFNEEKVSIIPMIKIKML